MKRNNVKREDIKPEMTRFLEFIQKSKCHPTAGQAWKCQEEYYHDLIDILLTKIEELKIQLKERDEICGL